MLIPRYSKASDSRNRLQSPSSGTAVVGKALDEGHRVLKLTWVMLWVWLCGGQVPRVPCMAEGKASTQDSYDTA